jgi:hypothetical protein
VRRLFGFAIVVADVVAADRLPNALGIELEAQNAGFVRECERALGGETEIAHAPPLGREHDRVGGTFGELDVAYGIARARAFDLLRVEEEVGQEIFPPDARAVEIAARCNGGRPHAVALLIGRGFGKLWPAKALAAPHGIEETLIALVLASQSQAPDPPPEIGIVPAGGRLREGASGQFAIFAVLAGSKATAGNDCFAPVAASMKLALPSLP